MAEGASVTFLLQELRKALVGFTNLMCGAKDEFRLFNEDLRSLKAFLAVAEDKPEKDASFRDMEEQVRDLVCIMEDMVDTSLTQEAMAKEKIVFSRCLEPNRVNMAQQVKNLREQRVKPKLELVRSANMGDTASRSGRSGEEPRPEMKRYQSIRKGNDFVDVEDQESIIIDYLMESKQELDVISIVGMPGLGKTTLARKIYQNKRIINKFPTRIWIHVSQSFNSRDVFVNILENYTSQDTSSRSEEDLIREVSVCLDDEKFLLVLDDVWSVDDWQSIKRALPSGNRMGKVLITSREESVGMQANRIHKLRPLSLEESWKLLQFEVYGNLKDWPQELNDIGHDIAKLGGGVPLAILVKGGILVDQLMKTGVIDDLKMEWGRVSKNVTTPALKTDEKSISDDVAVSYSRLDHDLRKCFLYLGVFPEQHEISAWTLTRLWIAEGFIQPDDDGRRSLEEIAYEYLDRLINTNLLMVVKRNLVGEAKICRVHDTIRAFCRSKALEQKLFQEIRKSREGELEPPVSEEKNFRRLCLHSDLNKFLSAKPNGPHVCSFLCFQKEPVLVKSENLSTIPHAFKLLKVLDSAKSIKFDKFPTNVTNLLLLRYITLCIDNLESLPEEISQIWNLQTLVVETRSYSIKMEANIWKMTNLRHLKTNVAIVLDDKKGRGDASKNLQTLSRLSPESCTAAFLKRARSLKKLGIHGELATLFENMSLEKLHRLERLKLVNDSLYESACDNPLHHLPQHHCFPPYLKRLTLSKTFLAWSHMSKLSRIDTLEVLKLKDYAFTGISWIADSDRFKSLQFLLMEDTDLVQWEASDNNLPKLKCLVLKNCDKLKEIPVGLPTSLEKLDIDGLRKSAVESARKIEEERDVGFKLSIGPECEQ